MPASRKSVVAPASINEALQYARTKNTYRTAKAKFGIPRATLQRRIHTAVQKQGRKAAFTADEERIIVGFLIENANKGLPMTQKHLRKAIQIFMSRMPTAWRWLLSAEWNAKAPSNAFLYSFRQRYRHELSFARPVPQKANHFRQVNSESITNHFATLQKLISEYQIGASGMFNLDECVCTSNRDAGSKYRIRRLMPRRGARDMPRPGFANISRIAMMPVISARGEHSPPLFLMKATRIRYRIAIRNGTEVAETPLVVSQPSFSYFVQHPTPHVPYRRTATRVPYRRVDYTCDLQAHALHVYLTDGRTTRGQYRPTTYCIHYSLEGI